MLKLSAKWGAILLAQPESGMGYQIVSVQLRDGRTIERVAIVGGFVAEVDGSKDIPSTEEEIVGIKVVHGR